MTAVCILCVSAFGVAAAAPEATIVSSMSGTVAISGTATPGSYVTAIVLNPGYTEEQFTTDGAIQYFAGQVAADENECGHSGNYCFHAGFYGTGGTYTIIVNDGAEKSSMPFTFYPASVKFDLVESVNDATKASLLADADETDESDATVLDIIFDRFSLAESELYSEGDKAAIAGALVAYRDTLDGDEFAYETAEDLDAFYAALKEVSLVAAYNADKEALVFDEDDNFLYADTILSIAGTEEVADYAAYISDAGKESFKEDLFEGTYKTASDIEEAIKELTYFYVLVDYVEKGSGHVEGFFDKYGEAYEEAGFKLEKLDDVKNPSSYYSKVAASTKSTLATLAKEFNDLFKGGNGGGSGTGKVYVDTGATTYVPGTDVITPATPVITPAPATPVFTDLEDVEWAADAISALSEQGIINGKGDGKFAPGDNVTRAEFVKIIVSAFGGVNSAATCNFFDVADDWSKPYIATALHNGFVSGVSETEFAPAGQITREQAAVIIYKVLTSNGKAFEVAGSFADEATVSAWAKDAVSALKGAGIINGRDGDNFCPADKLTRAEAAKLIYSIMNVQ